MPVRPSTPSTPLVGRDEALDRLRSVVDRPGLVTVTGTGGVGKTRLVGALLAERRTTVPATVVDLDYLAAPAGLTDAVARVLVGEAYSAPDPLASVAQMVRDDDHLLVLDGLDPELHDPLDVVALRDACPRLRVVVTSLRRLGVGGEHLVEVAPLPVPTAPDPWASPALALLVDRLGRAGYAVDPERDLPALVEICRRAGGVPLALELVAAWAPVYAPADIAALVGSSLELFSGGGPDLPERQRDLRALIDLSVRHLTAAQRTVLATVVAVPGGIEHRLLAEVCGDGLPLHLRALVERHLVHGGTAGARFDALDPVRLFVERELATQVDDARAALAERVVDEVARWGPLVGTERTGDAVRRLASLGSLLVPTVARLAAARDRRALDIVDRLTTFWLATARTADGEEAVDAAGPAVADDADRARLALATATLLNHRREVTGAAVAAERALLLARTAGAARSELEVRARLALARSRWLDNDEAAALAVLTATEDSLPSLPGPLRRLVYLELAAVHHNAGDETAADRALDAADLDDADNNLPSRLDAAGLRLAVVTGVGPALAERVSAATAVLASCDWPFVEQVRLRFWTAVRQVTLGDLAGAARTLEPARRDAERTGSHVALQMAYLAHAALRSSQPGGTDTGRTAFAQAIDIGLATPNLVGASIMLEFAVNLAPVLGIGGDDLRTLLVASLPLSQGGESGLHGTTVGGMSFMDAIRACGLRADEVERLRAAPVTRDELVDRLTWLRTIVAREPSASRPRDPRLAELSARELEILHLVSLGKTDQDIADELVVGVRTVNTHVANVRRKLAAPNRRAAAAVYRDAMA